MTINRGQKNSVIISTRIICYTVYVGIRKYLSVQDIYVKCSVQAYPDSVKIINQYAKVITILLYPATFQVPWQQIFSE